MHLFFLEFSVKHIIHNIKTWYISQHGSFSYLWKITFGINHQKWCFPAASVSHYHNFKLLSYFCGTITSHSTVLSHLASKESNRYRAGRGWKYSLQIQVEYMTQPDEGSRFGEAELIHRQRRERGTKKPHVSAGSILCSVLPVPVTLKLSFQLTPCATLLSYYQSVHWKHLLVCGGTRTALFLAAPTSSIACACLLQFLGGYSIWSTASINCTMWVR